MVSVYPLSTTVVIVPPVAEIVPSFIYLITTIPLPPLPELVCPPPPPSPSFVPPSAPVLPHPVLPVPPAP